MRTHAQFKRMRGHWSEFPVRGPRQRVVGREERFKSDAPGFEDRACSNLASFFHSPDLNLLFCTMEVKLPPSELVQLPACYVKQSTVVAPSRSAMHSNTSLKTPLSVVMEHVRRRWPCRYPK